MTSTTEPTDQYIQDATCAVLDDLPTAVLSEVLAYGMRVLAGRLIQAEADLVDARMTLAQVEVEAADRAERILQERIAAALDEEPGIQDPDEQHAFVPLHDGQHARCAVCKRHKTSTVHFVH